MITIDLTVLFFILLTAAVVSLSYSQPNLSDVVADFGHQDSANILFYLSAVHWILGPAILIYSAWDIHFTEVLQMDNLWETIGVCAYLTFLGQRYATLRTWVKREEKLHAAFRGRYFNTGGSENG